MHDPSSQRPELAPWSEKLTCYTAALGTWRAFDDERWWRPLARGGPALAVDRQPDALLFRHHPVAPGPAFGLPLRTAGAWGQAWAGLRSELDRYGRVVVAGDAFRLPWHPSSGRAHAPHWFVLHSRDGGGTVDDPLGLVGETGTQVPTRTRVAESELPAICAALPDGDRVAALREAAVLGADDPLLGPAYRWLEHDPAMVRPVPADGPDTPSSLHLLADHLAERAGEPDAYDQADDVWQAVRQREFVVAALARERQDGADVPDPARWEPVVELWRTVPPLLLHARLLAAAGRSGRSAASLTDTLHRIAEAEKALGDARFPDVPATGER